MPQSVNDAILDDIILRTVMFERFSNREAAAAIRILNNDVIPDVVDRLQRGLERAKSRGPTVTIESQKQLRVMMAGVDSTIRQGVERISSNARSNLQELALAERTFMVDALRETPPVRLSVATPHAATIKAVVERRPFQGRFLREWWADVDVVSRREIRRQVNIGLVSGDSTAQIVRRVRGSASAAFGDGTAARIKREAERVVRTAVNHTTNRARGVVYEENADLLAGVMWVSTLDTRTSSICQSLDGQVFPVNSGERPPAHPLCRSTTTPVLKSGAELGLAPGMRASMDGEVPEKVKYPEWIARQSYERQVTALGRTKADLLQSGKASFSDFHTRDLRPLSVREILTNLGVERI